jgi:hypothetical protein
LSSQARARTSAAKAIPAAKKSGEKPEKVTTRSVCHKNFGPEKIPEFARTQSGRTDPKNFTD